MITELLKTKMGFILVKPIWNNVSGMLSSAAQFPKHLLVRPKGANKGLFIKIRQIKFFSRFFYNF